MLENEPSGTGVKIITEKIHSYKKYMKDKENTIINFFTFVQEELKKHGYTFHAWRMFDEDLPPWYTIVKKKWKFLPFFLYSDEFAEIRFPKEEVQIIISKEYKQLKVVLENIAERYRSLEHRYPDWDRKIHILITQQG